MTEVHVAVVDGAFRCYRTTNGLDRDYFGPRFGGPRLAGQYADLAAGKPISPLRTPRRTEEPVANPPATPDAHPEDAPLSFSRPDVGVVTATSRGASSRG